MTPKPHCLTRKTPDMSLGHRPICLTRREVPKEPKGQWRTYDDWISAGRHVMKGQRSLRRDKDGKPVFGLEQTEETVLYYSDGKGNTMDDYDSGDGYDQYDGDPWGIAME